jgi:hypothetical protein
VGAHRGVKESPWIYIAQIFGNKIKIIIAKISIFKK